MEEDMMEDGGGRPFDGMCQYIEGDAGSVKSADREEADRLFSKGDYRAAAEYYRRCADTGDRFAKWFLGVMYCYGIGVDFCPHRGFELIRDGCDPQWPESMYRLAVCYFNGTGTEKDRERAFEMFVSLAENGYPPAQVSVSEMYRYGDYVQKDPDAAVYWLEKAVSHDSPKACCNMAEILDSGEIVPMDRPRARKLWIKAAELHYPPALRKVGSMYLERDGGPEDRERGISYLTEAAEQGDTIAAEELADYYLDETGGNDVDKAIHYYEIALNNGNHAVNFELGTIYLCCKGHTDFKKAFSHFEEGRRRGIADCSYRYAFMKMNGMGTEMDEKLAFDIFLEGAKNGHLESIRWVANCYDRGIGTKKDRKKAINWFELGEEKGDPYCIMKMGLLLFGTGPFRVDEERALKMIRKSFEMGESQAAYELGMYYENCKRKSMPDAIYWYQEGVRAGNADCMVKVASHYESGTYLPASDEKAFELYKRAYDTKASDIAAAEIGRCFEEGIGTEPDTDAAMYWYLKVAKKNAFSMWRLYNIYMGRGETETAVFWLRRSAASGAVSAMVELAMIYEDGNLIPKSDLRAMYWYHRASDLGNKPAREKFSRLVLQDPQDTEGLSEYEKAARRIGEEKKDDEILDLADSLADGNSESFDPRLANIWYDIAINLGLKGAREKLSGLDYIFGRDRREYTQTTLD